jgi:hypothetical protein
MMPPDLRATRIRMRCKYLLVSLVAGISLYAAGSAVARDPAAPYLGMSQAEIIACAGEPHARLRSGANAETLTYRYNGAGPVPAEPAKSGDKDKPKEKKKSSIADIFSDKKDKKKDKDKDWTCSASLKFEDGKLVSVNFAHKDVRSPYAWQAERDPKKQEAMRNEEMPTCTFSLPRCSR